MSETVPPPKRPFLWKWVWLPMVFTPGICFWVFGTHMLKQRKANALSLEMTVQGSSSSLQQTTFLPLWDMPIPEGHNAVWSLGGQLAWQRLRDKIVKADVHIQGAEALCERLNTAPQGDDDIDADTCLADAGRLEEGIAATLREKIAQQFTDLSPRPEDLPEASASNGLLAYAVVQAEATVSRPFFQNRTGLHFTSSAGETETVQAFGLGDKQRFAYREIRNQIQLLFDDEDGFALDLNKYAMPHQCLLAKWPRGATLAATWEALQERIAQAQKDPGFSDEFLNSASLSVPQIFWDVTHTFEQLSGPDRAFKNPGFEDQHLEALRQRIHLKIDRGGANPISETRIPMVKSKTRRGVYDFDGPFLLVMKDRRANYPFLMVWFDNAELFDRR